MPSSYVSSPPPPQTTTAKEYVGHPMIDPADLDDDLLTAVDAALAHRTELNRHATALTRAAQAPAVAHTLYLLLSNVNAHTLTEHGPMAEFECPGCLVDSYVKRGLLQPDDEPALVTAQTKAARLAFRFSSPPSEDELALLHHDPAALVRAAYTLARDLLA